MTTNSVLLAKGLCREYQQADTHLSVLDGVSLRH